MEVLRGFVISDPWIFKFAKPSKVHWNFIIETHEVRRLVEILKVLMVIKHFNEPLNQLPIDIHSILIEPVVKVISKLLVLSLTVCRVGEVILVERVFENILRLYDVHRPSSH